MINSPDTRTTPSRLPVLDAAQTAYARQASILAGIVSFVLGGLAFWMYLQGSSSFESVLIAAANVLAALLSLWLWRRGRAVEGILLIVAVEFSSPLIFIDKIVPGQSLTLALTMSIILMGTVLSVLPSRWVQTILALSFVQGVFFLVYDYYLTDVYRQADLPAGLTMALILALVYGIFNRRQIQQANLRARLVVALVTVALIPLIVLAAMNNSRLYNIKTEEISRQLSQSSEVVANNVDAFVVTQLDSVRTESRLPALQEYLTKSGAGDSAAVQNILRTLNAKDPVFITSYALLDNNGTNLIDTVPDNIGQDESQRQYFYTALASGRPFVSNVFFYRDAPRVYFSSAVRDESGQAVGVLRVEYNAVVLQWLINNYVQDDVAGLYVILVDNDNYLRLGHSRSPDLLYLSYLDLSSTQVDVLQKLGRLPEGELDQVLSPQPAVVNGLRQIDQQPFFEAPGTSVGGELALTTAQRIASAPWTVMARIPVQVALEAVGGQTRSSVILALIIAVLVGLVGAAVTQLLAAPIVALTRVAQRVAEGDLHARADEGIQDEIGTLARTFNQMTGQLTETLDGLEQRVADRTRALELSSDVSRRLSTILNTEQLITEVVELLQFAFNYYHVHIYLFDAAGENLVLQGGTGEAGKILLERQHSLPRGRGLVGQACETGTVVLVEDTNSDPNWLPNPLLPETRSEIAIPILLGDEVLGALDVQQDKVNALTQQDAELLRGIASQLAIALRNARQYDKAEQQARREAAVSDIIEQIQKTQSVEDALQVTARELGRMLNTPRTHVRLQSKQQPPVRSAE